MKDLSSDYGLPEPATNPTTIGTVETLLQQENARPAPDVFGSPAGSGPPLGTPVEPEATGWGGIHTGP